jgi:hypothetical protein
MSLAYSMSPTMNAPVRIAEAEAVGDIEDFRLCCAEHRYFLDLGILALPIAVDNLQWLAERWGLTGLNGQDEIQRIMALAVGGDQPIAHEIPLVPLPDPPQRTYRIPQATVDAFFYVVRLDDAKYLRRWLAQHPLDAPQLLKIWERKNALA